MVRDHTIHTHTYYLCCTGLMVAYIGNKLTAYRILRSICILTLRRTRISKNVLSLPLFFLVFFSLSHSLYSFYLFFILHYTVRRVTYFNFTLSLSFFYCVTLIKIFEYLHLEEYVEKILPFLFHHRTLRLRCISRQFSARTEVEQRVFL